jgi:plastocyanin
MRPALLAALCVAAAAPALPRAGEVRGEVRYRGTPPAPPPLEVTKDRKVCGESARDESVLVAEGGLANVVVRVVVPGAAPVPARVALDQRGCRFVPHVVAAPVGSTVDLMNGDPLLHGVHGWSGVATAFNVPMALEGERKAQVLARPGPIRVGCDVHGWMTAWILVVDGPHYAVTDARGRFAIAGVPAGTWTAIAWHERLGERIGTVKVPPDGAGRLELDYP